MKRIICVSLMTVITIIITLGVKVAGAEESIPGIFKQANEAYQQGKYEQAIQGYQEILAKDIASANLYYNLGNCYVKTGQVGRAILNYKRGQLLAPDDADLKANLDFAHSLRKNSEPDQRSGWFIRLARKAAGFFSLDAITLKASFLYWLTVILLSFSLLLRDRAKSLRKFAYVTAAGLVIFTMLFAVKFYDVIICKQAVVIVPEVDSCFAPADNATVHFQLFEGSEVIIIGESGEWLRVKTSDSQIGWVRRSSLESV